MELKKENVKGVDFGLPVTLEQEGKTYTVAVDGVVWLETENQTHAVVMYHMVRDHIAEYMTYVKR